jgi:micrococcal nuclease
MSYTSEELSRYTYKAKIVAAYDGDTIDVEVDLGFNITNTIRLRLNRINAPEIRGGTTESKALALEARDFVRSLLNQVIIVKTFKDKKEKYGRYLADVYFFTMREDSCGFICLNDELVDRGLAVYQNY